MKFCNSKFRIFSSISSSLFSLLSSLFFFFFSLLSSSLFSSFSLTSRSRSRSTQEKMFVLESGRESENQEFFILVDSFQENRIENFLYKIKKDGNY